MHAICPQDEEWQKVRLAVTPPGFYVKFFEVSGMESLEEALSYESTYRYARTCALKTLNNVIQYHKRKLWPGDDMERKEFVAQSEGSKARKEVLEMVKLCCIQERRLLEEACSVIGNLIHFP